MANEEQTDKSADEWIDKVWDVSKSTRVAMLATWDGNRQAMRPMSGNVERSEHAIYFLAGFGSPPVTQILSHPDVMLGYVDGDTYLTIWGAAKISSDRAQIKKLWSPMLKAWWDSAEDPSLRVIVVTPHQAEIWDGPNKLVAGALMLTAAITDAKPAVGDHAKLKL